MLPQEITSLGERKELIIMENVKPILAEKIVYYKEPAFVNRLKKVSKTLRAAGAKIPTKKQMDEAVQRAELAAKVPLIDLEAFNKELEQHAAFTVAGPSGSASGGQKLGAEDIDKLGPVDFSSVKRPPPGEMDEAALKAYADDLCRAMGMNV